MPREPHSGVWICGCDVVVDGDGAVVVMIFGDDFVFETGEVAFIGVPGETVADSGPDVGDTTTGK